VSGAGISEETIVVDGVGVFLRRTEGEGTPVVFAHGNPSDSSDWSTFLARLDRPGIAFDMPGWGRSSRPAPRDFDYSMSGLAGFFGRCLEALSVDRYSLVVHDWGVVGLIDALGHPERLESLVSFNVVPILPGHRWHWIARWFWRRPGLGELFNLAATRPAVRLLSRQASATPGPMPDEFIDRAWETWSRGTWPQMLRLYRSADPEALAAAGYGLDRLTCPALIAWPTSDPYIPARFGEALAARLPAARLVEVERAGHWPWIDQPQLVEAVAAFLDGRDSG
jgi:pimeloyl-ACP methyl ester carboxylesterase